MSRRRAAVIAVAAALMGLTTVAAPPTAQAATCQTVPGSTIGTDVTIAGQKHRVPAISQITLCVGSATAGLVTVQTSGGACTFSCLSVLVGGDTDAEGITISYREDGVLRTVPVSPGPVGGPDPTCVFSVGSPDAPYPDCFIAIGPELDDHVGQVEEAIADAEQTACDQIPPAGSPSNDYEFCEYPHLWANSFVWQTFGDVCELAPAGC